MSFVLTKGTDDEDTTEFAYVACGYAYVPSENQSASLRNDDIIYQTQGKVFHLISKY